MTLLSPLWLIGLLPWAAVLVYLLRERPRQAAVPFLALWAKAARAQRPRHWAAKRRPPLFVLLMLLAMLLAILATGRPALRLRPSMPIVVILDRGVTMSPQSCRAVLLTASDEVAHRFAPNAPVDLVTVPGYTVARSQISNWASIAESTPPTALSTREMLEREVNRRLRESSDEPILVLTDEPIEPASSRVVVIPPQAGPEDVGITAFAARARPTPQVMVRLRNQSARSHLHLVVRSDQQVVERGVSLPPRGQTLDQFIDVPGGLSQTITAQIDADDAPVNDRAWLVREALWPVIDPRTELPAAVRRMMQVYSRLRPASGESRHVAVSDRPLPPDQTGVWIVTDTSRSATTTTPTPQVSPHPITADIGSWPGFADDRVPTQPPAGFTPIVTLSDRPTVAVREAPARQVWLNVDLDAWSHSPDFVVFFSNVFDWLGDTGTDAYVADPIGQLGAEWTRDTSSPAPGGVESGLWPGLYRRSGDGAVRAVNPPDVRWLSPPAVDWRTKLADQPTAGSGRASLWPELLVGALLCGLVSLVLWPLAPNARDVE
jgi:hypothetical protein